MKKFLLTISVAALATSVNAQVADGFYCIQDVATGTFLNAGFSWGTAAVMTSDARVFEIINNGDGTCKIKSSLGYCKGGDEIFMDGPVGDAGAFQFEKDGEIFRLKFNGKYYAPNEDINCSDSGNWWYDKTCHGNSWVSLKINDNNELAFKFKVISLADMKAGLNDATPANPVNATFMMQCSSISKNDPNNLTAWEYIKDGEKADFVIPPTGWWTEDDWSHQDLYGWCINDKLTETRAAADSEDTVQQNVEGLPAGKYDVVYRVVNQDNTPLEISLNGTKAQPASYSDSDLWYGSAFNALKNSEKTAEATVGNDGNLNIKMTKQAKSGEQNRFAFKNFKLFYKGSVESSVTDIIEMENENAPEEYFTLQGTRVINPSNGIYIVRKGSKVTKRVIR